MTSESRNAPPDLAVLLLAAGKGTRLGPAGASLSKVLLDCLGVPLIEHVRRALDPLGAVESVIVVGHAANAVEAWLAEQWPAARSVLQEPQNGTGHAARIALDAIPEFRGDVLIAYGDVPQLLTDDLQRLLDHHRTTGATATVLTGVVAEPGLLGRVVRGRDGTFERIVEARDASPTELQILEFNTGIYVFESGALRQALHDLSTDNAQGEEYATDAVGRIAASGARVEAVPAADPGSLLGVNDWIELASAVSVVRRRLCDMHMRNGVHVVDPDTTVIEVDVELAPGARVLPFSYIGRGCKVGPGAVVGPFARLRGNAVLEERAEIGNFVEVKKSVVQAGAKAKHLTYLGDAVVGEKANVGCGTITANYDGVNKHRTVIGPEAHIGSGTVLVAPVEVGRGARTGANAVVLAGRDVPADSTVAGVPAKLLPHSVIPKKEPRKPAPASEVGASDQEGGSG